MAVCPFFPSLWPSSQQAFVIFTVTESVFMDFSKTLMIEFFEYAVFVPVHIKIMPMSETRTQPKTGYCTLACTFYPSVMCHVSHSALKMSSSFPKVFPPLRTHKLHWHQHTLYHHPPVPRATCWLWHQSEVRPCMLSLSSSVAIYKMTEPYLQYIISALSSSKPARRHSGLIFTEFKIAAFVL